MANPAGSGAGQTLAARLDSCLPQTQCTRCGFPDCRAYADALATGSAALNRCPPGGHEGVRRLAALLGQAEQALDPTCGQEGPRLVAVIDEDWCIGCTLCLDACPVDAIVGANKLMHTVMADECTGCDLCAPACPVDCIQMRPTGSDATGWAAWSDAQAGRARVRYQAHVRRVADRADQQQARLLAKGEHKLAHLAEASRHTDPAVLDQKRQVIAEALARARARRSGSDPS